MKKRIAKTYDEFMTRLDENNLGHLKKIIDQAECKILIGLDGMRDSEDDVKYNNWCKENCIGRWAVYSENYVFFNTKEDAIKFKLRWI